MIDRNTTLGIYVGRWTWPYSDVLWYYWNRVCSCNLMVKMHNNYRYFGTVSYLCNQGKMNNLYRVYLKIKLQGNI